MIAGLRPYSTMKDSGVEWLGKVPAHWEMRRLKQICRMEYGDSLAAEMRQGGSVQVFGSNGCVGFHDAANTSAPCIILGRKGSFGKVHHSYSPVFAIDTTYFIDEQNSSAHIRWLYFLLGWLRLDTMNRDSAVPGLNRENTYQHATPLPPLPEQRAIVCFLDHADRRIRRYIRARQKLIALLKEQKQAIIHQAVTGQIDVRTDQPYPAYKPSGVEWLGEVPAHWEIARLKSSVANIVEHSAEFGQHDIYIALEHVESWTGQLKSSDQDTPLDSQLKRFESEDILFGKLRPYLAKVTRPTTGGLCVGEFLVLRSRCSKFDTGYVEQLLRSKPTIDAIDSSTFGAKMPRAEWGFIGGMEIVHPPLPEQRAIVKHLDRAAAKTDAAIARAQREIDLLREYRTRLIADVVTGKLDVRKAATALPEADPLAADDEVEELLQTSEDPESGSEERPAEFAN